jgi:hypothetical protein
MDFLQSKFFEDLKNGKLPVVEVTIAEETLWQLFGGVFFLALAILLIAKILKSV